MLLRTVVEIPFHPTPFGVAAAHDARPRLAEGVRLLAQLVERRLERRVELRVVERQPDLPGEVGEDAIVIFGEGGVSRDPLDDDESEQFPGVADGRHPQLGLLTAVQQGGQPDGRPGASGHAGTGDDRALPAGDDDRPRTGVGHRHRSLQHLPHPGVHLGAHQSHGLAQRFGELEEELVHGDGPRQAAAECSEHLVGRLPGSVDETGGRADEPLPSRDEGERGNARGQQGQPERRPFRPVVRLVPQAQLHHQVDRRHHGHEPEQREGTDEQARALRGQPSGLAGHQRQRDERGGPGGDRAERAGPTDQHVEHGDHQRDRSRQDRPDGEPLQTLAVVPDRGGIAEPHGQECADRGDRPADAAGEDGEGLRGDHKGQSRAQRGHVHHDHRGATPPPRQLPVGQRQ